jgi:YidC/Oxa1 family membrane protein insertase
LQALQPTIKEIQAKYQSNPEVMNQKVSEIYQSNDVNPLAGCVPSLVQIPVFIGLYRGVLGLAKENMLDEPFLWLPNLEGPVYGADPTTANNWIFQWVDGSPPLGWDDTIAFLALPLFLVISQFVSMEIMSPKDGPQQGNIVLKLLPLMIGWFSLNVPAALCLYWVTNNIVTTATSVIIRNSVKNDAVAISDGSAAAAAPLAQDIFAPPPMREKPAGFASPTNEGGMNPITAIDAEIIEDGSPDEEEGSDSAEPSQKVSFENNVLLDSGVTTSFANRSSLFSVEARRRSEGRTKLCSEGVTQ